jgi:hypothetical protein
MSPKPYKHCDNQCTYKQQAMGLGNMRKGVISPKEQNREGSKRRVRRLTPVSSKRGQVHSGQTRSEVKQSKIGYRV